MSFIDVNLMFISPDKMVQSPVGADFAGDIQQKKDGGGNGDR